MKHAHQMAISAALTCLLAWPSLGGSRAVSIPSGTRVYLETEDAVSSKRGKADEGALPKCHVWRDVVVEGEIVAKAGTPALVRIDKIVHAKMAGQKGKLTLGAYETKAVDGQTVQLSGGYHKDGEQRMALAITLGAMFILPIFLKGKEAELPAGTIFDAYTGPVQTVTLPEGDVAAATTVDLSALRPTLAVEVLLDKLAGQKKPSVFDLRITVPGKAPQELVVDRVNGEPIEPVPIAVTSRTERADEAEIYATVAIKPLAAKFRKGINRFEVAYQQDGGRVASEVVLNVQF